MVSNWINYFLVILAIYSGMEDLMSLRYALPEWCRLVNCVIYVIFVIDYVLNFIKSKSKKGYFIEYIFELLAIIPIGPDMKWLKAVRIFKEPSFKRWVKKFKQTTKLGSTLSKYWRKGKRLLNTNGLKYVLMTTLVVILGGAYGIMLAEGMSFNDALWWSFVTATTVGYGDLSPATSAGRIIAGILMLMGIGLLGMLTSSITSYFITNLNHNVEIKYTALELLEIYEGLSDSEKVKFKNYLHNE